MTPSDHHDLLIALKNKNHPRRSARMDADMRFRYLNKTYTKPVVDEEIRKLEAQGG